MRDPAAIISGPGQNLDKLRNKLRPAAHRHKIDAIFNFAVGIRNRIIENYGPKVITRIAQFEFFSSLAQHWAEGTEVYARSAPKEAIWHA
jgi:hypothetical protein